MKLFNRDNQYARKINKLLSVDANVIESPPCKGQTVPAHVLDVYDGDTITAVYLINKKTPFKIKIRIEGIDTPELRTRNSEEKTAAFVVRDYLFDKIHDQIIKLKIVDWDKFGGRVRANVLLDDKDIGKELVTMGYAREYHGEKKEAWTTEELKHILEKGSEYLN